MYMCWFLSEQKKTPLAIIVILLFAINLAAHRSWMSINYTSRGIAFEFTFCTSTHTNILLKPHWNANDPNAQ